MAYLKPINHRDNDDFIVDAIVALTRQKEGFDEVYGKCAEDRYELNVPNVNGSLDKLLEFVGS
ncbi:conserved domain protein [delta proteobacterium NaphS2]|nr:conserved domain protein [delta proteobacterium NaphS2]